MPCNYTAAIWYDNVDCRSRDGVTWKVLWDGNGDEIMRNRVRLEKIPGDGVGAIKKLMGMWTIFCTLLLSLMWFLFPPGIITRQQMYT